VNVGVAAFHLITFGGNEKIPKKCKLGKITADVASAIITLKSATSPEGGSYLVYTNRMNLFCGMVLQVRICLRKSHH
jgi:hypothetical protein